MKMILKGDYKILSQFNIIQQIYQCLGSCISQLSKVDFIDNKRELEFNGNSLLLNGYTLKVIENKNTETFTVIIK